MTSRSHRTVAATSRLLASIVLSLVLSACSGSGSSSGDASIGQGDRIPPSDAESTGLSMSHVHGIGRNPADGDVYVATHHGLWRVRKGGDPELVGEYLHDFMGFSVVGPDRFVASGHPNSADELPSHLGLIESDDAGKTWTSGSLLGTADFHALRVSGDMTYGWNSQGGSLMSSEDRRAWETLVDGVMMLDVAAEPEAGEILLASVATDQETLGVQRSLDSGRSFEPVDDAPQLALFAWPEPGMLRGFATDGAVWGSGDDGESWNRVGDVEAMPDAVAATEEELLAAAGGKLLASADGGASWTELARYS